MLAKAFRAHSMTLSDEPQIEITEAMLFSSPTRSPVPWLYRIRQSPQWSGPGQVHKDVCTRFLVESAPHFTAILLRAQVMAISCREFEQKADDRMF